jgi:hypothetical protein
VTSIGVLLISALALQAVEGVGYRRGRFGSAFWRLPLDDKLAHVADHRRDWWWISIWGLVGLFLMSGGVFGLAYLLADAGAGTTAYIALGAFAVAVFSWVFGQTVQAASVPSAATQQAETGATPAWIHPLWDAGYLAEGVWVIGANLAYAVFGIAILQTDLLAGWAGWVSLIGGVLIPVVVLVVRDGFPQLGILLPAVIGVAVLIAAV